MSMKNPNDTIVNQTRDLPVCNEVPQQTGPPRGPNGVAGCTTLRASIVGDKTVCRLVEMRRKFQQNLQIPLTQTRQT